MLLLLPVVRWSKTSISTDPHRQQPQNTRIALVGLPASTHNNPVLEWWINSFSGHPNPFVSTHQSLCQQRCGYGRKCNGSIDLHRNLSHNTSQWSY